MNAVLDKSNSETVSSAVEDPHQGTSCNGMSPPPRNIIGCIVFYRWLHFPSKRLWV